MVEYDFEAVVEYCMETVGDAVRAAVTVDETDHETLYVRSDIKEQYRDRPGGLRALIEGGRSLQSLFYEIDTGSTSLGEPEAAVITFEHAILIQFIPDQSTSLAVSFDREVGQDLVDFIEDSLNHL